jgi:hypothetical protein
MEIDSYSSVQRPVSFPSGQSSVAKTPSNERRDTNEPRRESTVPAAAQSDSEAEFDPSAPRGSLLDISV